MRVPGFGGARKGQPEPQQQPTTSSDVFPEGITRLDMWTTGDGEKVSSWKTPRLRESLPITEVRLGDSYEGDLLGGGLMSGSVIADVQWTPTAVQRGSAWLTTQLSRWRSSVATHYADQLQPPYSQRNQR